MHLNAIFEFAIRKRWCHANPRNLVDKPAVAADDDREIRFLDQAELDALLVVPAPRRHRKRTLERAAEPGRHATRSAAVEGDRRRSRSSAATAIYLYRATADVAGDEDLWRVDLAMYLTAAMSGPQQAELVALR